MTGGNVGDRPLTQSQPAIPGQPHPGNEAGDDWNRDQQDQILDRVDGTSRKPSARRDDSPLQDDEDGVGTTTNPGSEGTTRY